MGAATLRGEVIADLEAVGPYQMLALARTETILPMWPGCRDEKRTHDYVRHGTTTCSPRSRWPPARSPTPHASAPAPGVPHLPQQVAKAYPRRRLHIVLDNCGTHKHPKVQAWLARNPCIVLHFTRPPGRG